MRNSVAWHQFFRDISSSVPVLSHGPQQHGVPVKVEKPALTFGESADVDDA